MNTKSQSVAGASFSDAQLTQIYNQANGIPAGKAPPISTQKIFTAMRAMADLPKPSFSEEGTSARQAFITLLQELPPLTVVQKTMLGPVTAAEMLEKFTAQDPAAKAWASDVLRISRDLLVRQSTT